MIDLYDSIEQKISKARDYREVVEIEEKLKRLLERARSQRRKFEEGRKKTPNSKLLSPLA